jgi:hypothetical protein
MSGEGNDDIGPFIIAGCFDAASGECHWTKPTSAPTASRIRGSARAKASGGDGIFCPMHVAVSTFGRALTERPRGNSIRRGGIASSGARTLRYIGNLLDVSHPRVEDRVKANAAGHQMHLTKPLESGFGRRRVLLGLGCRKKASISSQVSYPPTSGIGPRILRNLAKGIPKFPCA